MYQYKKLFGTDLFSSKRTRRSNIYRALLAALLIQISGIALFNVPHLDMLSMADVAYAGVNSLTASLSTTTPLTKILSSDIDAGDWFGDSLDVDGTTAIIAAYKDDDNGENSGSAYIYSFDGANWIEGTKINASDGADGDLFGFSARIDGTAAIVGAPEHDFNGKLNVGAAYVYRSSGNTWSEEDKLMSSDYTQYDTFGWATAIFGDIVLVGSPGNDHSGLGNAGAAYVFTRAGSTWTQEAKLLAPNLDSHASGARFGYSIDLDGTTAVIGAPHHKSNTGAAYVYQRLETGWSVQQQLFPSDGGAGHYFGTSLQIEGNRIIVSAPYDNQAASEAGALYVFEYNGSSWVETAKLMASDAQAGDRLGYFTIGLGGDFIGIGSGYANGVVNESGATYLFGYNGSSWTELRKIVATDASSYDRLGISNAMDSNNIFVGAERADAAGVDSGAVYILPLDGFGSSNPPTPTPIGPTPTPTLTPTPVAPTPTPSGEYVAQSEIPGGGTVTGSYTATYSDDNNLQTIQERHSGGKPQNRTNYLEHTWTFSVNSGAALTLIANAYSSGSADGDAFSFAYSTDGQNFTQLFTVTNTNPDNVQTALLPNNISGTVYIRVTDSDRTAGRTELDTITIDQLVLRSETVLGEPPLAPTNLVGSALTSNQIQINWADNSLAETGFQIERKSDADWSLIDTVGANVSFYDDSNVIPNTLYQYRVRSINASGASSYSNILSVTTPDGSALTANGYKVKGVQTVDLNWSSASSGTVDIYRDGLLIGAVANSGSYTDNIGIKGGGTYQYQVCESGTTICTNVAVVNF